MMPRKHAGAAAACLLLAAAAPCAGAAIRGSTTLTSALQPAYSDLVSAMSTGGSSPGGGEGGLASGFGSLQTFNETRLADMEVGALPLTQLFTPAGIAAAQKSAGCEGTAWRSRMEAVHGLVEHSYILTLPRPGKFVATAEQAERLLSVGWPAEKVSLFIGPDCNRLWGEPLVKLSQKWFGGEGLDVPVRTAAMSSQMLSNHPSSEFSQCDLRAPLKSDCSAVCCGMAHQMAMIHAFHQRNVKPNGRIMIFEEDATFAPAAFALSTETALRGLGREATEAWHLLKLGECETFTDDERALVAPADKCTTSPDDTSHTVKYQQVTTFAAHRGTDVLMLPLKSRWQALGFSDLRAQSSYCGHAYVISESHARHLVRTQFPIKNNGDDQLNDACESRAGSRCLRVDKYLFNQHPKSGSSLATSCHPCNGEDQFNASTMNTIQLEKFEEPRPSFFQLQTGAEALNEATANPAAEKQRAAESRAATRQPKAVNNMCGMYASLSQPKKPAHLSCTRTESLLKCADACRKHGSCTSYIHHPTVPATVRKMINISGAQFSAQYFLCQQDPYTDLSETLDAAVWEGQCCMRGDDKWNPFIPPIWYQFDPRYPHVVSGSTFGAVLLAGADVETGNAVMTQQKVNDAAAGMTQKMLGWSDQVVSAAKDNELFGPTGRGWRMSMTDDMPDYLAAPAHDEIDAQPFSDAAVRHANTVEYLQYGTVWAVARKQCQRQGMDLCPPTSYCKNGKQTRMTHSLMMGGFYVPAHSANRGNLPPEHMWMPTRRGCNSWINLKSCAEPDGANPDAVPYLGSGNVSILSFSSPQVGCCAASEERTASIEPDEAHLDHDRRAFLARPNNRNFILNSLNDTDVRKQMAKRGRPAVLRIVVNHPTSGLFASFQWVMLAMRFAKAAGLRAYIDHGPCVLCGYAPFTQDYSYHDWTMGPNAWSYFWEPVDTLSDLMAKPSNSSVDIVTLDTHMIWKIYGTVPRFDIQSFQQGDFSGKGRWGCPGDKGPCPGPVLFNATWWAKQRGRAWQLVGSHGSSKPIQMSKGFVAYEQNKWDALLAKSSYNDTAGAHAGERPKLIAAHIRGTDKQCGIGGPKIPAEDHFELIDAYLAANPGALVFVATDAPSIAQKMRTRYGSKLLMEEAVRSEKNALHEHGKHYDGYAWGKAAGAMLDSSHLSRADFLLCANSALGESAVWLNPKLADNMYNLQFPLPQQLTKDHAQVFGAFDLNALAKKYTPGACKL